MTGFRLCDVSQPPITCLEVHGIQISSESLDQKVFSRMSTFASRIGVLVFRVFPVILLGDLPGYGATLELICT